MASDKRVQTVWDWGPPAATRHRLLRVDGRLSKGVRFTLSEPAWASWIPGIEPSDVMTELIRSKAFAWVSFQRPVSAGEIRPSGVTAVASTITSPAPPTALLPRCTRCQSFGTPSELQYWHMGETKIRLRKVTPRSVSGEKSFRIIETHRVEKPHILKKDGD